MAFSENEAQLQRENAELLIALTESLKLQSHYAEMLAVVLKRIAREEPDKGPRVVILRPTI